MEIIIKQAMPKDISNIVYLNKKCLPIAYSIDEYLSFIDDKSYIVLVVTTDDKYIGYLVGQYVKNKFHIMSIGIDSYYRKMKIGTRLMQYLIKNVSNCKLITLYVHVSNKNAIQFYKSVGYSIKSIMKDYYGGVLQDISQDAYEMEYILKN